jgi:hypothetical protein
VGRHPHRLLRPNAPFRSHGFAPTWRFVPHTTTGALPIFGVVHARASGDSLEGYPSKYSPLPFTSLGRVPVFSTTDSTTSLRWWLAVIPFRQRRFPAWIEGILRLTSIGLPACPCNTRCRLPFPWGSGSSGYPNRCGRIGRDFTEG